MPPREARATGLPPGLTRPSGACGGEGAPVLTPRTCAKRLRKYSFMHRKGAGRCAHNSVNTGGGRAEASLFFPLKKKKNLCTLNSTLYLTKIHDGSVNTYVEHIQGGRVGGTPPPLVQGVLAPSRGRDTQASTPQAHDGPGASSAACPVLVTTPHTLWLASRMWSRGSIPRSLALSGLKSSGRSALGHSRAFRLNPSDEQRNEVTGSQEHVGPRGVS